LNYSLEVFVWAKHKNEKLSEKAEWRKLRFWTHS